ncbi:transcription elongation factor a [Anaeramoeba flamelloides]|uniref:Transcription elongation factor a n=1 Tax=Anaeramoeba flamelloides TaxID=1746091 RepID=A0AAV7ZY15_9EUKA|nr:transcription elongation factor a [Anaeramoeba flamelloides]
MNEKKKVIKYSRKEEKETAELIMKQNKELVPGDYWCLIEINWFLSWQKYIEQDFLLQEKDLKYPRPGKIDNSSLFVKGNVKRTLVRGEDFLLIHLLLWEYFHSIYGGEPLTKRKVLELGKNKEKLIVVHQKVFYLYSKQNGKVKKRATIRLVVNCTIEDIVDLIERFFSIKKKNILKLFLLNKDFEKVEELDNLDQTIYESNLKDEDKILWEAEKKKMKNKPKKQIFFRNYLNNYDKLEEEEEVEKEVEKEEEEEEEVEKEEEEVEKEVEKEKEEVKEEEKVEKEEEEKKEEKEEEEEEEEELISNENVIGEQSGRFSKEEEEEEEEVILTYPLEIDQKIQIYCINCQKQGKNVKAVVRCQECPNQLTLCESCDKQLHSFFIFGDHNRIPITKQNEQIESVQTRCSKHQQYLTLFCYKCEQLICYECHYASHKNHKTSLIQKAIEEYTIPVIKHEDITNKKLKQEKIVLKAINILTNKMKKEKLEQLDDLNSKFKILFDTLECKKIKLSKIINEESEQRVTNLSKYKKKTKKRIDLLNIFANKLQDLKRAEELKVPIILLAKTILVKKKQHIIHKNNSKVNLESFSEPFQELEITQLTQKIEELKI